MLIVCGFAFDPSVSEEVKRYGKLVVLPTKMNPDLAMGEELLKKTGAGNLFMVFGEQDVEIKKYPQSLPRKRGRLRRTSFSLTREACCGNRLSSRLRVSTSTTRPPGRFAVRRPTRLPAHRHRLQRRKLLQQATRISRGQKNPTSNFAETALRADIDEAAWSSLYSTVSRPFDKPASGKIAVKVINHYGDEVLKVFSVK